MEVGVPHGSPILPILLLIHTAGLIQWAEERGQAEGHTLVDNLGWVATRKDLNPVVEKHEPCAAQCIEWARRRDLQLDTAKAEAALFTCRRGHKNHLRRKLTAKIKVGNSFVRFNIEVT